MSAPYDAEQQRRILEALHSAGVSWPAMSANLQVALGQLWTIAVNYATFASLPSPPTGAAYRDIARAVGVQAAELRENILALLLAAPARHSSDRTMLGRWQQLMRDLRILESDGVRLAEQVGATIPTKHPNEHDRPRLFDWMMLEWLEEHFGVRGTVVNPDPAKGGESRSDVLDFLKAASEPIFGERENREILRSIRLRNEDGFLARWTAQNRQEQTH